MSSGVGSEVPFSDDNNVDGTEEKPVITFNHKGDLIGPNKSKFVARCLDLVKTRIGITYDTWRHVPLEKKDDVFVQLQNEFTFPANEKDSTFDLLRDQVKTWKKNIRNKYFGTTRESVLAYKNKVPAKVLVSVSAWNTFVEREATTKKLNQRLKAQENRSKKKDAHYLGRTSYAEKEVKLQGEKRKADRVVLYVDARQNPKTKEIHPGAISDVEKLLEIRSTQDEATRKSIDTDALAVHFGKDRKGRVRGVSSTVSRTKMKAITTLHDELETEKTSKLSTDDKISDMLEILKTLQANNTSCVPGNESRGSYTIQNCMEKLYTTPSPSTPTSGDRKMYNILKLDGSKKIATATIVRTLPGAEVHSRPMLPLEVKLSVFHVEPGMENEPIWKGSQGGEDNIGGFVGGYLVWPKYLLEEVVGDADQ